MHRAILACNLIDPWKDMSEELHRPEKRGYRDGALLTGEFLDLIATKQVKPLSVDDVSRSYCETRRDLYQKRGRNKSYRHPPVTTWGKIAGRLVETCLNEVSKSPGSGSCKIELKAIKRHAATLIGRFEKDSSQDLKELRSHVADPVEVPERLLRSLEFNTRAEIAAYLSLCLCRDITLKCEEVEFFPKLHPRAQIGISSPAVPDFIAPRSRIVGDIKTGINFLDTFPLTCAGYALAYENEMGLDKNIDFGIVYFFQTRRYSQYAKPVTFGQPYIFVIDDYLRDYFCDMRDRAYEIVSSHMPPDFPVDKSKCHLCSYRVGCQKDGLQL